MVVSHHLPEHASLTPERLDRAPMLDPIAPSDGRSAVL